MIMVGTGTILAILFGIVGIGVLAALLRPNRGSGTEQQQFAREVHQQQPVRLTGSRGGWMNEETWEYTDVFGNARTVRITRKVHPE